VRAPIGSTIGRETHPLMSVISSRQHSTVRLFREAARGGREQPLLLDGWHLVTDAVRAGLSLYQVAVAVGTWSTSEEALLDELHARGVPLLHVTPGVLEAMSPVRTPSGVVALAPRPACAVGDTLTATPPLVLVGVDLQDPGNVGASIRVAEAAGATGAIYTGSSADPWGWKALRAAMGSSLRLPVVAEADLLAVLAELKRSGVRMVGTVPREGRPFAETQFSGPTAVLVGGEGAGLPQTALDFCDTLISIPMNAPVESLNVAVTAGLLLYEARRQRAKAAP
jgi:RNA methyltransferase, TrmH family